MNNTLSIEIQFKGTKQVLKERIEWLSRESENLRQSGRNAHFYSSALATLDEMKVLVSELHQLQVSITPLTYHLNQI